MDARVYVPPGWPLSVPAPVIEGWEAAAGAWLLDHAPPEFRHYPTLRRQIIVLAYLAWWYVEGQRKAVTHGLSEVRGLLSEAGPNVAAEAIEVLMCEQARLLALRRSMRLVIEALEGARFTARL